MPKTEPFMCSGKQSSDHDSKRAIIVQYVSSYEFLSFWIFSCNRNDALAQGPYGMNEIFYSSNTETRKKKEGNSFLQETSFYYLFSFQTQSKHPHSEFVANVPWFIVPFQSLTFSALPALSEIQTRRLIWQIVYWIHFMCWAKMVKTDLVPAFTKLSLIIVKSH